MVAYQGMGAVPTWTCTPYQVALRPQRGQQIAWGESNAVAFANSVCGARTERYPDLMDVCAAIAGRVPAVGLHLTENRAGQVLFRLHGIPPALQEHDTFMPALGYLVGKIAQERVCVVDGLEIEPDDDRLKALCAAVASAGAVALVHLVGITPEAPTLEAALQGRAPIEEHRIDLELLRGARDELSTAEGTDLDMVALGSPHFSLAEFRRLEGLIRGRRVHEGVRFLVTSNRAMVALAREEGLLESLEAFGGSVTVDTCIITTPMMPDEVDVLMTNSAKYAYYAPGLLGTRVAFGSIEDCVRSAISGRVVRDTAVWGDGGGGAW
jgi:predicted aconitase